MGKFPLRATLFMLFLSRIPMYEIKDLGLTHNLDPKDL